MNLHVTDHAVLRYVKRIEKYLTVTEAREVLTMRMAGAAPLRECTVLGQAQFVLTDLPPCTVVVKNDTRIRSLVVVTVLPPGEQLEPDEEGVISDEVAEAYARQQASKTAARAAAVALAGKTVAVVADPEWTPGCYLDAAARMAKGATIFEALGDAKPAGLRDPRFAEVVTALCRAAGVTTKPASGELAAWAAAHPGKAVRLLTLAFLGDMEPSDTVPVATLLRGDQDGRVGVGKALRAVAEAKLTALKALATG